jgi:serine/threonine protein kinase
MEHTLIPNCIQKYFHFYIILKIRNILLKNNQPKIADFGVSKEIQSSNDLSRGVGTTCYQSPEILTSLKYDGKTDIWSLGCVIFEILFHKKYSLSLDDTSFNKTILQKLSILIKSYEEIFLFLFVLIYYTILFFF